MRVLFIVPYVPSLIRTRPYNLIRSLTARGHEVTVVTPYFEDSERVEADALRDHCHRVVAARLSPERRLRNRLRAVATLRPTQSTLCWVPELAREIAPSRRAQPGGPHFDVVHVEHLRAACYGIRLRSRYAARGIRMPIVWDSVDCLHLLMSRALATSRSVRLWTLSAWDALLMKRHESRLLNQFQRVIVTSSQDRDALLSVTQRAGDRLAVIPNGVDLEYFCPDSGTPREVAPIVMSGKMSYHANIAMALDFVREILPRIQSRRPDVRLRIVGKSPPKEIRRLADNPSIRVTGTIDDIRPHLRQASIAVTPIRYGVGIQNKVLEAMACATPVVGSPQSISALTAKPGEDVLVGEHPDEFASHCLRLLQFPEQRDRFGRAGRSYVEREHQWAGMAARFERIYEMASRSIDGPPDQVTPPRRGSHREALVG